ncbi:MAG: hypothetical protein JNM01_21075 [Delftia acidovorans]|jgi:hypothetical protein|uniref:hypothetical protein n=1 Tax=uncultured Delftia sp. TaxID=191464 RepID=UPI0004D5DB35|nr:hypothetical protein [uncultured Delftia sp.]KEH07584.1 hypothetical protein GY14_26410 [Delftia tsuruhatensis]MBL8357300.1 hypothetical protein [Delftia acidovorans]
MYCIQPGAQQQVEVSCDTPDALLVITRLELAQLSPFYLDLESAVEISGAMLMAMAVAFVLRQVRKYLESKEEE